MFSPEQAKMVISGSSPRHDELSSNLLEIDINPGVINPKDLPSIEKRVEHIMAESRKRVQAELRKRNLSLAEPSY
jgi:hypothetical protein